MESLTTNPRKKLFSFRRKKKRFFSSRSRKAIIIFTLLFLSLHSGTRTIASQKVKPSEILDSSEWIITGSQRYLHIKTPYDDFYSRGFLLGYHLSSSILSLMRLLFISAPSLGTSYNEMKRKANTYFSFFSEDERSELEGIRDGVRFRTGLPISFSDILLQNTWLDIIYGDIIPSENVVGCTLIIFYSEEENRFYLGQNFDFLSSLSSCLSFVYEEYEEENSMVSSKDCPHSFFSLRIGASLAMPIGKNSINISSLISVVKTNLPGEFSLPLTVRTLRAFTLSNSLWGFGVNFYGDSFSLQLREDDLNFTYSNPGAFNLILSNETDAIIVDSLPRIIKIIKSPEFSLNLKNNSKGDVRSNTFVEDEWQEYLIDPSFSKNRQLKAEELLVNSTDKRGYSLLFSVLSHDDVFQGSSSRDSGVSYDLKTLAFYCPDYFALSPNISLYALNSSCIGKVPLN